VPAPIDLRSDTVTRPTDEMRRAMAQAEVGDDGFGDDPTVRALEERYASLVGKQAAVFVPSGVMANQIAVRVLTRPGDTIIAGTQHHVVEWELGAAARNSGVQFRTIDDSTGLLDPDAIRAAIAVKDHHQVTATLLALENTHMYSGGTPVDAAHTAACVEAAQGLPVHLDGARLFNASVALGSPLADLAAPVTTVMSCLSKGLSAPIGSLLAGPEDLIAAGRIERKRLGGTMRQAGIIAAAGLVALDTMVDRLADDHVRASRLADAAAESVAPDFDPATCRTNIVAFDHPDAVGIVRRLGARGVLGDTIGPQRVRLVVHSGITDELLDAAIAALRSL
jgi:threonine aldolase